MIKIIVELHPFGDESKKRILGIMKIWNDGTGSKTWGNYRYRIINPSGRRMLHGEIKKFKRTLNVWNLLHTILKNIIEKENKNVNPSE